MAARKIGPYGSWKSPVSFELIAAQSLRLRDVRLDDDHVYWLEMRPADAGRHVVVRLGKAGKPEDVTGAPFDVRTRVHEYGGGAFLVDAGTIYFTNFADQRLYRNGPSDAAPVALTPESKLRYADPVLDRARRRLLCVVEDHSREGKEAENRLAAVPLSGGPAQTLVSGYDFYSSPRLSPDGKTLAWLCWRHPNMPWDGTELWTARLDERGIPRGAKRVAGGPRESIFQPEWSPEGVLHFVSDRTGWWNLYALEGGKARALMPRKAEFGLPQWVFGMSSYGFAGDGTLVCAYAVNGEWRLARLKNGALKPIQLPFDDIDFLRVGPKTAVFLGASPKQAVSVVRLDLKSGKYTILRRAMETRLPEALLSAPENLEFPTTSGRKAYGFYYPPRNPGFKAPSGEKPPLLVISHGGPTASTSTALSLEIQFWTSRGLGVLDVNYGGSTGYGRAYRERLNGNWGVVDVDDCVNGARFLVERGDVDARRVAIRGGSAGGYTTLAALAFRDFFKAGASYYGVADIEALMKDTHKFESRYDSSLIGPHPKAARLYRERSPIHHVDRLSCPLILLQGSEDKVVPPNQSRMMYEALRKKGIPVAYLEFPGEQHGFRRAENIKRALEAELYFYSRIFGFTPADTLEPVPIENL